MSRTQVIDRYEAGGRLLAYATQGLAEALTQARPGPGAWSLAELVGHLLDDDLLTAERIKRVLTEPEPELSPYDENARMARLGLSRADLGAAVALFADQRLWLASLLRPLDEADFARAGNHLDRGRLTLARLVVDQISHLDHHLRFLYAKRGNLGVFIPPYYSRD